MNLLEILHKTSGHSEVSLQVLYMPLKELDLMLFNKKSKEELEKKICGQWVHYFLVPLMLLKELPLMLLNKKSKED